MQKANEYLKIAPEIVAKPTEAINPLYM